jgi:hypothetical protein
MTKALSRFIKRSHMLLSGNGYNYTTNLKEHSTKEEEKFLNLLL